ncbi:MAG: Ig-like domain-containing protein [Verrucomicrobiota bacterium]
MPPYFKAIAPLICIICSSLIAQSVEKWDRFEVSLLGPSSGNPYVDVTLEATFSQGGTSITVPGFYDGNGIYKIRFMPRSEGVWNYTTASSAPALDGQTGSFTCVPPTGNNHGPVSVRDTFHFQYEDGTPYFENGTTVYGWINQTTALQDLTLQTLSQHRFNKLRLCVFPKSFYYGNDVEPEHYPVEGTLENWDFTRFVPAYWQNLETRVGQLRDLGIEADIIIIHPYDSQGGLTFGFKNNQTQEEQERYWRYLIARLGAYRNVWWSMANEYHLVGYEDDFWNNMGIYFQNEDPYNHLRSIHNFPGNVFNQNSSWITHVSYQGNPYDPEKGGLQLRNWYQKPIVYDEARYEGDVDRNWGQLSGEEMTLRYWDATVKGTYLGHGESYFSADNILWWSRGGSLKGTSPERIDWFDTLMNYIPEKKLEPVSGDEQAGQNGDDYFLYYYGEETETSRSYSMPAGINYRVTLLDTWNMTIADMGVQSGDFSIATPEDPYLAVQMYKSGTEPTAPTFIIDSFTANKAYIGNAYTGSVASRAFDPNGDAISYLKTSGPGWLSVAADGTLSGSPSAADIGSNIFSVEVSNTNGESDTATMTILVVSSEVSPIQFDDFNSGFGNWSSSGDLCFYVDNNDGTGEVGFKNQGDQAILSGDNDLPLDGFTDAIIEFSFRMNNRLENGDRFILEMTINGGKSYTQVDSFSINDFASNVTHYETVIIGSYTLTDQTRFRFANKSNRNDELTYIDDIRISGSGGTGVNPPPTNTPPVFNVDPINGLSAGVDSNYSETVSGTATDADGDALAYGKVGRNSGPGTDWLTVASDGSLSGTPTSSEIGSHSWTIQVSDGNGGGDSASLNITVEAVNSLPIFASDPINGSNASEDAAYSESIAGSASDPDGDTLTYSKVSRDSGTGTDWLTVASGGALSGTPTASEIGLHSWTVQVSDGNGGLNSATLNITVDAVNSPPIFASDPINRSDASEDAAYSESIAGSASDPDGDALTYSKVSRDNGPGADWLTVASDGSLSGTPTASEVGSHSWTIQVSDGNGGVDSAILNIRVDAVNDFPSIIIADFVDDFPDADGDGFQLEEGSLNPGWEYLWNPSGIIPDSENYALLFANTADPEKTFWNDGIFTANGSILFNAEEQGDFQYGRIGPAFQGMHPGGGVDGDFRAVVAYTLQSGEAGDVSITNSFLQRSKSGKEVVLDVYVNDAFQWSRSSTGQSVNFDGDLGTLGVGDTVYVMLGAGSDGTGADASTLDFTLELVNLTPPNNDPQFALDPFSRSNASEDAAYSDSIASSASDPDGDTLSYNKTSRDSGPGSDWLTVASDGALGGTPSNSEIGTHSWTIQVADGNGGLDSAVLTIIVDADTTPVQTPFLGSPHTIPGLIEAEHFDYGGPGIASNDTTSGDNGGGRPDSDTDVHLPGAYEYSGSRIGWVAAGEWMEYTVDVQTAGNYDMVFYTSRQSGGSTTVHVEFEGIDVTGSVNLPSTGNWNTFQETIVQVSLNAGEQVMRVAIDSGSSDLEWFQFNAVNGPPTFLEESFTSPDASEGIAYSDTIAGSATDPNGDTLSYDKISRDSGPGSDWLSIALDGTLSGTPSPSEIGIHSWTVEVDDGSGGMDTASLSIVVNPASQTIVIADFADDFPETGGDGFQDDEGDRVAGWDYLWNPGGVLADAENYVSLSPNTVETSRDFWNEGVFTSNGSLPFNDVGQGDFRWGRVGVGASALHPGGGENGDFRAIAAYTLQDGEAGTVSITNSFVQRANAGGQVALDVYVNDTFKWSVTSVGDSVVFDGDLGTLETGDTIYVMLGGGSDGFVKDATTLDFTLEATNSPTIYTTPEIPVALTLTSEINDASNFSLLTVQADGHLVFSYVRHKDGSKYDYVVLTSDDMIEWNDVENVDTSQRPIHTITNSLNENYELSHLFFSGETEVLYVKVQMIEIASF